MDDLESMFWVLFWIFVHYSDSNGRWAKSKYERWNFRSPDDLAGDKIGLVAAREQDFLYRINTDFTDYYTPLVPWINRLGREVFPSNRRWTEQDPSLYDRMRDVLERAAPQTGRRVTRPPPKRPNDQRLRFLGFTWFSWQAIPRIHDRRFLGLSRFSWPANYEVFVANSSDS